jgi:alpha-tubulin suppressor-like RCC1 family protein
LTSNGKVYAWGNNSSHQCGVHENVNSLYTHEMRDTYFKTPQLLSFKPSNHGQSSSEEIVTKINASSKSHSFALTASKQVFFWGTTQTGLNLNLGKAIDKIPRQLKALSGFRIS